MPIVLSFDLGTTSITSIALDTEDGEILAQASTANNAETTSAVDKKRGRSEWDARQIAQLACECGADVVRRIDPRRRDVAAIGVTGQQHGMLLVDERREPVSPLVNWQDRRGGEPYRISQRTFVEEALRRLGDDARARTGCRMATGFLGLTLFWLNEQRQVPPGTKACFLADYFTTMLTGREPAADPTNAAGSGLLNIGSRDWDVDALAALGLEASMFCEVRPSGEVLGPLAEDAAKGLGLTPGIPIVVALGDHQASFVGSVADAGESVLVNIGTGGQVAALAGSEEPAATPQLEMRPFPFGGNLLVAAGLSGGRSYAVLERFLRDVGRELFGATDDRPLFETMNRLAASSASGAEGLRCDPRFAGTRAEPELRGSWTSISPENLTAATMVRSLFEGMAEVFQDGRRRIEAAAGKKFGRLVASGNAVRENDVLRACLAERFSLAPAVPRHREEAAFGAALVAAVGAGLLRDAQSAGRIIRYET